MSYSLGGGNDTGSVHDDKTYLGQDSGRKPGALDDIIAQFMQGQQRATAQNDRLFGGKNYGSAKKYFGQGQQSGGGGAPQAQSGGGASDNGQGPPGQSGQGNGMPVPGQTNAMMAKPVGGGTSGGYGDGTILDDGSDTTTTGGGGTVRGNGNGVDGAYNLDDQWDPNSSGNDAPDGGLVGYYQGQQDNPWQQGPNGDAETDVLGSYDYMASGARNGAEADVYNRMGQLGTQGTDAGGGRTLEGLSSDFNRQQMSDPMTAGEHGAADTYAGLAGGPNDQEAALYGDTGKYGSTMGQDQGDASSFYRDKLQNGGYDDATKAAMDKETMGAARAPIEQARDRILRGAAARGNPSSTMGAEIALAGKESGALSSTARQNKIAQAQEAIRQKEGGATGLMGSQSMTNAQKQYALSQRAGQNAQQASERVAGAQGLNATSQQVRAAQQHGSEANTALANEMARRRAESTTQQAGQNAQQRALAAAGTQGKQSMFSEMAARKAAGTAGTQHLYDVGQQQRAGDLSGAANVGGKTSGEEVRSGSEGWGI